MRKNGTEAILSNRGTIELGQKALDPLRLRGATLPHPTAPPANDPRGMKRKRSGMAHCHSHKMKKDKCQTVQKDVVQIITPVQVMKSNQGELMFSCDGSVILKHTAGCAIGHGGRINPCFRQISLDYARFGCEK
jgi:hypothetical protein